MLEIMTFKKDGRAKRGGGVRMGNAATDTLGTAVPATARPAGSAALPLSRLLPHALPREGFS